MSKQTSARIQKLEQARAVEMAKRVCAFKGNDNPSKEQIERVVEFMRPDNLHALILAGLQEQMKRISKVEESR